MDRETELRLALDVAEDALTYMLVFLQETGEEGIVHDMSLADALERYPEWAYSHREAVKDAAYYRWADAENELDFYMTTKDMTEDELEEYLDCLSDYDYELDDY